MKHYWMEIDWYRYGDDSLGILASIGHEPTAADLADSFERTKAAAWGHILRGSPAGGAYGEIIMGIKKFGFEDYTEMYDAYHYCTGVLKNKSERHLRIGRRARKRAEEERKRLPYEPLF
jgi:hypothetical protein